MEQKTMKALVNLEPHKHALMDVAVPQILEPTDIIGKVSLAAICTSDIHLLEGELPNAKYPMIVGHEFCIEIVEIGSKVKTVKPGDRCVVKAGASCGECAMCKLGLRSACLHGGIFGASIDGCFAEYVRVPFADLPGQLIAIPDGLDPEDVILLPDMLATGWFGVENANLQPGQSVAVIGTGPVGLCTCLIAKKVFGAGHVVAIDIIQDRIDAALRAGVADSGINPLTDDIGAKIKEASGGLGVDVSIESAATAQSMALAAAVTRPGGVISTVSYFGEQFVSLPMNEMILKGQELKYGIQKCDGVSEMLALVKEGKLDAGFVMSHKKPLNDIEEGFKVFGQKKDGCTKWLVTPYER